MSEERSWAEETVKIGARGALDDPPAEPATRQNRRSGRSPGGRMAARAAMAGLGALAILVAVIVGAGGGADGPEPITAAPHRGGPSDARQKPPAMARTRRPVRRQAGALEIGNARPAPKVARSSRPAKAATAQAPEASEPEATPVYEPAPEPAPESESTSPPPAAETPASVEFGM